MQLVHWAELRGVLLAVADLPRRREIATDLDKIEPRAA